MPETSSPTLLVSEQKGIYVCEFTAAKIMDESSIKEVGDTLSGMINSRENPLIVLDFARVDYLSSAALGMLINVNNRLRQKQGQLRLCFIRPQILEVFVITKLNKLFKIMTTREEAIESISHR